MELIKAQKKLYNIFITFETLRLPNHWQKVPNVYPGLSTKKTKIPLHTKDCRLKKAQIEENTKNHRLEKLKTGENFMDTLNLGLTKALQSIY